MGSEDPEEWFLHRELFQQMQLQYGTPVLDLIASPINGRLSSFMSPYPNWRAEAMDALVSSISNMATIHNDTWNSSHSINRLN